MGLTGSVAKHPAQYSPEILAALADLIHPSEHIHDPFAGLGVRLGALCDRLGNGFTGTDIEDWPDKDPRVMLGDSTHFLTYPMRSFTVVTSPVYFGNRISSDYVEGPRETTKLNGRRSYGISLGRALDASNAARVCRPTQRDEYFALHREAAKNWGWRAIVNVDSPVEEEWVDLLAVAGYGSISTQRVTTRRYRVAGHGDQRADAEVIIDARRVRRHSVRLTSTRPTRTRPEADRSGSRGPPRGRGER